MVSAVEDFFKKRILKLIQLAADKCWTMPLQKRTIVKAFARIPPFASKIENGCPKSSHSKNHRIIF
jgi:hypothetical protein